jgi:hypothetical protein
MDKEENKSEITKLSTRGMEDTVLGKWDGYDITRIPKPTARNMKLYMDKINELTETVNRLTALLNQNKNEQRNI